jgi:hypothetical protein
VADRKLQLLNLSLYSWVIEAELLNLDHLVDVNWTLDILGQLLRRHDGFGVGVDQCLEEGTVVKTVEENHQQAGWLAWADFPPAFSLEVWNDFMFGWFLEINALIT